MFSGAFSGVRCFPGVYLTSPMTNAATKNAAQITALIHNRQELEGRIQSIESGLRYYDRAATPAATGEDRLPGLRAAIAKINAQIGELS